MSEVQVTFKLEATDPDDHTGLTEEDFDLLHDQIPMLFGGYDIEVERT